MSANTYPLESQVRTPRALLKVNNIVISEVDSIEYIENNFYMSDSFKVRMPMYNLSEKTDFLDYFTSQPAMLAELFVGFPKDPINYSAGDLQSLVLGGVNNVDANVLGFDGYYIEFDAFDLSKKFIDNKTVEKYPNLTASQIVAKLAIKRGLKPIVTETSQYVGYYYTKDYVELKTQVTEWDLMVYLAQKEGFAVFVRGLNLYFQPKPDTTPTPYLLQATRDKNGRVSTFNGSLLKVTRNLDYARDVIVKVKGWSAKTGRVEAEARGTPNKKTALAATAQPIGEAQTYEYVINGLTKEQALRHAQLLLASITQWERVIEYSGPGNNTLRKDSIIQLKGIRPHIDQLYYPDTITHSITSSGGYSMTVRAKNHSPLSTVVI